MFNNIDLGTTLVILVALYFVIKIAVKNGINQSMLFSDEEKRKKLNQDLKETEEKKKIEKK